MNRFLGYLLAGSLFLGIACENENKLEQKVEALMKLHDEEMAKMDLIFSLKKELKTLQDSTNSDSLDALYEQRINSLELADEAMMDWMRNYKVPDIKEDQQVKMDYYEQEYQKMLNVRQQMNQSIDSAKVVLHQTR